MRAGPPGSAVIFHLCNLAREKNFTAEARKGPAALGGRAMARWLEKFCLKERRNRLRFVVEFGLSVSFH